MDALEETGGHYSVFVRRRDLVGLHAGELFLVEFTRPGDRPTKAAYGQPSAADVLVEHHEGHMRVLSVHADGASLAWFSLILQASRQAVRRKLGSWDESDRQ